MNIPGIPDSIPRKAVLALIEPLGLALDNLISFHLRFDAIEAEVVALNPEGKRFMTNDDNGQLVPATHRILIPVVLEDES